MARGVQKDINKAVIRRINSLLNKQDGEWTLHKLSVEAGLPSQTLYDIMDEKQGTIGVHQIKKLCDAFDITVTEFFDTAYFRNLPQD